MNVGRERKMNNKMIKACTGLLAEFSSSMERTDRSFHDGLNDLCNTWKNFMTQLLDIK